MSEETKTEVVEEENPSTAEKETIALKKIGADVGAESITKVDLRETPTEETTEEPVEEAPREEQKEESQTETQESEESNQLTLEEIIEDEEGEEVKEEEKPIEEETTKKEVVEEPVETTPEIELPENIQKVVDFMNETGGTLEDYVKINQDYSKIEDSSLLYEYYTQTKSHLSKDEIDFLIDDNFSFDEEIDEPKDIKRKKLAYKEEIAKAKSHLEGLKGKYYEEVKLGSKLSKDQQEAVQFYNTYNTEQSEMQKTQEKQTVHFNNETNKVFSENFKGFEFKVGENKKYRFNIKDKQLVKDKHSDMVNVFNKYISEDNLLQNAEGYHKALFVADNADEVANHFYEQGRADAIKQLNAESKNVNMDPRKTNIVESGGVKVRAISGDDSSKLRVKIKK
tara:strand:+ start:529 stop:1716 length:1188 start_codon:yes stop_codon:yes gene_type:complete